MFCFKNVCHHCLNSFSSFQQAGVKGTLGRLVGVFEVTFAPSSSLFTWHVNEGEINFFYLLFFRPSRTKSGNTEPTFMFLSSMRYWRTGRTRSTSVNLWSCCLSFLHRYRVIITESLFCQQDEKGSGLKLKTPSKCCGVTSPCRPPTSRLSRRAARPVTEHRWSR